MNRASYTAVVHVFNRLDQQACSLSNNVHSIFIIKFNNISYGNFRGIQFSQIGTRVVPNMLA